MRYHETVPSEAGFYRSFSDGYWLATIELINTDHWNWEVWSEAMLQIAIGVVLLEVVSIDSHCMAT